ncbi:hypothetical protein [Armatimonas sp.]|uniref:hypothetical protein n=1 Tax=Armatimonas sp. TaxID=1872638 RepID=UPI00374DD7D9
MNSPDLKIELIALHHKRRRSKPPYSATAYLVDSSLPAPRDLIDAGRCEEAEGEEDAMRAALRDLQTRLNGQHDALVRAVLADPVGAITERRRVG